MSPARFFRLLKSILLVAMILVAAPAVLVPAFAQEKAAVVLTPAQRLDQARAALDQIEATLTRVDLPVASLQSLRAQLDPIAAAAQSVIDDLSPRLDAVKNRLDQLGPKPAATAPPENANVQSERLDLDKNFADIDATIKRARLMSVQVEQDGASIVVRRRALFTRALFERSASLLAPSLWLDIAQDMPRDLRALRTISGDFAASMAARLGGWRLPSLLAALGIVLLLYRPAARVARRVVQRDEDAADPGRLRKVLAAWWTAIVVAAIPMAAVALFVQVFDGFDLLSDRLQPLVKVVVDGVARVAITAGIARGLLSPSHPRWRLPAVSSAFAEKATQGAIAVAALISLTKGFEMVGDMIAAALPLSVALRGVGALAAASMMAVTLQRIGLSPDERGLRNTFLRDWAGPIRLVFWTAIVTIVCAVAVGYVALGSFIVDQIAGIAAIGSVLYLLLALADEMLAASLHPGSRLQRLFTTTVGLRLPIA